MNQKYLGISLIIVSILLILILVFLKIEIDNQEGFLCTTVHNDPALEMDQCPAHTSNSSWLFTFSFGICFLIFGIGMYMLIISFKKEKPDYKKINVSDLTEIEKGIYDIILKNEGSAYQSDIIKELKLTKVQATRTLDRLEAKKIIDRKRRGMTNIIILR